MFNFKPKIALAYRKYGAEHTTRVPYGIWICVVGSDSGNFNKLSNLNETTNKIILMPVLKWRSLHIGDGEYMQCPGRPTI